MSVFRPRGSRKDKKKPKDKTKHVNQCIINKRIFLNKPKKGTAFGAINIDRDWYINLTKKSCTIHTDASLTLSDCHRVIELSFGFYDDKNLGNTLYKINKVYGLVKQMKELLEAEWLAVKELKKQYPSKKKDY